MNINLKISKMTGKLFGIGGLNTNTISNQYCAKMNATKGTICSECYSVNMLKTFRKGCIPAWENNSKILSEGKLAIIPQIKTLLFRFNGHGELINAQHFENLVSICKADYNQGVTFALWTKRKAIIHAFIRDDGVLPSNLILVYSNPIIDSIKTKPPKHFNKIFNNVTINSKAVNCSRKCNDCRKCYDLKNTTQTIIELTKNAAKKPNNAVLVDFPKTKKVA